MLTLSPRLLALRNPDPVGGAGGSRVEKFLAAAMTFKGQPYKWGGGHTGGTFDKPGPVDCSGLVLQAARLAGANLDGTAATQQDMGKAVSMNSLQPGDLVFKGNPAYHVGIYMGNGEVLHAPKTGDVVRLTGTDGWTSARRVFEGGETASAPSETPRPSANNQRDRFERSERPARVEPQPGPAYVPQAGETLLSIAEKTLGDADRWQEIYMLNQHVMPSPYVLFPGQTITLPAGAKVDAAAAPAAAAPATVAMTTETPGTVGTFQNVQAFLGATKDKMGQILAGMAMG